MLSFWRGKGEKIIIGDNIIILNAGKCAEKDDEIKIGIIAPRNIPVFRKELKTIHPKITYKKKKRLIYENLQELL